MAQTVFTFKGIKPKKLQVEAIRKELLLELGKEAKDQQKELDKTTKSWKGDKPKFTSEIDVGGDNVAVVTGPAGSSMGVKKWNWLNEGTRVRRALMSRNWKSKTRPGYLGSGGGRGRVVFISRRLSRPGIQARGWTEIVTKRRKQPCTNRMIKAMNRGAQKIY